MLLARLRCIGAGLPEGTAWPAAGVFGRWSAFAVIAVALAGGCAGLDPLPLEKLAPEAFLEERRLQDEAIDSGSEEKALERITALLESERSAAALTLAARLEKDPEQALAFLEEAIAADPDFAWARYGFAFIVLREEMLGRYDESAANLEWLIERGFDDYWGPELRTRRLLIENLSRLGRPEAEAEQWEEFLERYPLNLEARFNLARLLCIKMQEPREALRHIDRILAEDPEALDARMLKGRALWDRGSYAQAAEVYEALARLHPNALLNLAILYEQHLGDPVRALENYERYRDYEGYNQSKRRWYDLNFLVPRRIEALSGSSP